MQIGYKSFGPYIGTFEVCGDRGKYCSYVTNALRAISFETKPGYEGMPIPETLYEEEADELDAKSPFRSVPECIFTPLYEYTVGKITSIPDFYDDYGHVYPDFVSSYLNFNAPKRVLKFFDTKEKAITHADKSGAYYLIKIKFQPAIDWWLKKETEEELFELWEAAIDTSNIPLLEILGPKMTTAPMPVCHGFYDENAKGIEWVNENWCIEEEP